jgi:DNA-binding CsgD family transcriptional regulator/tetratricopeptide (TPR) repeat protein
MRRRATSPVFVGREDELAAIRDVVAASQDGCPSITLVTGDAGVGKTRLVRQVIEQAREGRGFVLQGECLALSREFAYAPIVAALRLAGRGALAGALERLAPESRAEIGRLVPEITAELHADGLPAGQGRLFELLLALLRHLGDQAPVLFVIEDGHWVDASTRDFVSFLARNLSDARVAVIITYRSDELEPDDPLNRLLGELMRNDIVMSVEVEPLARDGIEHLLEHILGEVPPVLLVDEIFVRSQGNPFFAEELLAAPATNAGLVLPANLRDALLVRLRAIPDHTLELLRLLAVLGRPAGYKLLAHVTDWDEPALSATLRAAREAHLVSYRPHDDMFEFRHGLVREAICADLLPGERTRLHHCVAQSLAGAKLGTAAELALHWEAAGKPRPALEASVQAALDAQHMCASAEARTHFERAARIWDVAELAPGTLSLDRVDLLRHAAEAARLMADWDGAIALCREALALVDVKAEPLRAAMLYERLGEYHLWDDEAALRCYSEALALVPAGYGRERARILGAEALALHFLQRWDESRERAEAALEEARRAGAREEEAYAANVLGLVLAFLGDPIRGEEHVRLAKRIAEDGGSAEDVARVYIHLGEVLRIQGEFSAALQVMVGGEALAAEMGMVDSFGRAMSVNAAEDLLHLGRWDDAYERLRQTGRRKLSTLAELLQRFLEGRLAVGRGDFSGAAAQLSRARELCDQKTHVGYLAGTYAGLAELALWEHRPRDARAAIAEAFQLVGDRDDPLYAPVLLWMGVRAEVEVADQAFGHVRAQAIEDFAASANRLHGRLARIIERYSAVLAPAGADAYLRLASAELTRLDERPQPDLWKQAARKWHALSDPYLEAYALWRRAESVLVSAHPRAGAADDLRAAWQTAVRLDAAPLRQEIGALARAARIELSLESDADRRPLPPRSNPFGLTAREMDVLRLVAQGCTNRQVAARLFISEKTASVHVSHILSKLDAENRVHATAIAHRFGLLDMPVETD